MSVTPAFVADPRGFTSLLSILVDEARIADTTAHALSGLAGGPHMIPAANFRVTFDFELFGNNGAVLTIKPAGTAGATPCYFLPYKPDCGISMTLGNGADYFFTSTLTGCSVQAVGPRAAPIVTHANGRASYAGGLTSNDATGDQTASQVAQTAIDAMLQPTLGAAYQGCVRKADYVGRLTGANMRAARGRFRTTKRHHRVSGLAASMYGGYKPEIGAFVFGVRGPAGWEFHYQSSVAVTGTRHTGFPLFGKAKPLISEEVVLGPSTQFYP